ncbi:hypothetical protein A3A79_04620 [Candidatus Gottesmanbacteria bacterium RIFCSPLOWO2_01_FULL_43_11b]|uniref:Glycosyltransferase 2-like domain-containing protein n=1 Tax=Candidatus Gottesmanbacteria bacterium RIFCSPLOWO2_01_FULL_43_11b TaxID=1798392 RepID=A0A1F6AI86_9BACT|nr:MAG: hypothetical protein A3A79_04620 [Candidatus Gottesmanbacteria bacterium RIFCSPLOWO2_01_FULL_43_11b]
MNQKNSKISAVVLTKNDEEKIKECLESLRWVDEVVLVDNESTDKTPQIAVNMGAQVVTERVQINFSKLRNIGKEKATGEFLLYVDSDERVTAELKEEILDRVSNFNPETSPVAFFITRKNYYLGRLWPYRDRMERFFWKRGLIEWEGKLHESPRVTGKVGQLKSPLLHYTHRTLEEMLEKTNQWSEIEADLRFRANHPPIVFWRLIRVIASAFFDSFIKQGGWRAGVTGWIESIFQSYSAFITYAKLWEKQQAASGR